MAKRGTDHGVARDGVALEELPDENVILGYLLAKRALHRERWWRAEEVAHGLGVQGSRRLGVRASKGNWSGAMKAGVRLAPRLLAMHRRGLVHARYDSDGYVWLFRAPRSGETVSVAPAKRTPTPTTRGVRQRKPVRHG